MHKNFWQNSAFIIKSLSEEGIKYLTIIKDIYDKTITNIISYSEKLKVTLLRSGTRQRHSLLPLLFKILSEVLGTVINKNETQNNPTAKAELSLFVVDMMLCSENPRDTTKNNYEQCMISLNLQDTKLIYRNLLGFYMLITNYQKEKLRGKTIYSHNKE